MEIDESIRLTKLKFRKSGVFYQKSGVDQGIFFNESGEKSGDFLFEVKGALYVFFLVENWIFRSHNDFCFLHIKFIISNLIPMTF
jgi:hypothetical protein